MLNHLSHTTQPSPIMTSPQQKTVSAFFLTFICEPSSSSSIYFSLVPWLWFEMYNFNGKVLFVLLIIFLSKPLFKLRLCSQFILSFFVVLAWSTPQLDLLTTALYLMDSLDCQCSLTKLWCLINLGSAENRTKAAGWEVRMLLLCYAATLKIHLIIADINDESF